MKKKKKLVEEEEKEKKKEHDKKSLKHDATMIKMIKMMTKTWSNESSLTVDVKLVADEFSPVDASAAAGPPAVYRRAACHEPRAN